MSRNSKHEPTISEPTSGTSTAIADIPVTDIPTSEPISSPVDAIVTASTEPQTSPTEQQPSVSSVDSAVSSAITVADVPRIRRAVSTPIHLHYLLLDEGLYLISVHVGATAKHAFMYGCLKNTVNDVSENRAWTTMAKKAVGDKSICFGALTQDSYENLSRFGKFDLVIALAKLSIPCADNNS